MENALYDPIARVLRDRWIKDKRYDQVLVEIIAYQGRRFTGGRWTRPDIVVATYSTYTYVPGRHFEVITFEIKPSDAINITALYEALSHARAASKSYVIFHIPEEEQESQREVLADIQIEAREHGVGVIIVEEPGDYETWEELVEAQRFEPDPARLNEFLANQVSNEFKEQILKWFR